MIKMEYYKMSKWLKRQEEGILSLKIEATTKTKLDGTPKSKISIITLNVNGLKIPIKEIVQINYKATSNIVI